MKTENKSQDTQGLQIQEAVVHKTLGWSCDIKDSEGGYFATSYGATRTEAEMSAKRIVRTENMHDELVEGLKDALGFVQYQNPRLSYKIEQLLKQAEQK